MNKSDPRQPSGPECARYASLIPQFRQGPLSQAEDTALRAHLASCAYCQAQLANYDRLDAALSTYSNRFAHTAPASDDLVRVAVARVASAAPAANHHRQPQAPGMRQREDAMFDPRDPIYDEPTIPQRAYRPPRNTRNSGNNRTRPVLAAIAALLLVGLAATLFALFGRPSSNPANNGAPTATTQPTATSQPTATPQPTAVSTTGVVNTGHPCGASGYGATSYIQIGDLKVSRVGFSLDYSANELPANLDPSKPYQLPDNLPNPPNLPVNPHTSSGNGYLFTVCNTSSTTSHVIAGVTVRIAAFSAYSGALNTYMFCDAFYQRPIGVAGGGCGGGRTLDEVLQASFPANATTGAQITATQVDTATNGGPSNAPPLPVSLGPGQMLVFGLGITPPTAPGTYAFAFGLSYDAITTAHISTMQPTLFDTDAVKWSGQGCTKPALLSQIPTSDTTGKYVCAP